MDPCILVSWQLARWLPRASGDGPRGCKRHIRCKLAAPRERGWTVDTFSNTLVTFGCPARAGMDPASMVTF